MVKVKELYKRKVTFIFISVFLLAAFLINARAWLDPDFGWHLRHGQMILNGHFPKTDSFSYTMPSYVYGDHEWLIETGLAALLPVAGLAGLSLLFGTLSFFAVFLQGILSHKKWVLLPLLLSGSLLSGFVQIRMQVISWLLFSVLITLLFNDTFWQKGKWFLPPLFLVWANSHGAFPLGLVVLMVALCARFWPGRRIPVSDIGVFVLSIAATFINPYGIGVWEEVIVMFSDPSIRWSVQEWMPSLTVLNFPLLFFFTFSSLLVIRYRKKIEVAHVLLYVILSFLALSSIRHLPFWLIFVIPLVAQGIGFFFDEVKHDAVAAKRLGGVYKVILITVVGITFIDVLFLLPSIIKPQTAFYPEKALAYLRAYPTSGNVFAPFEWGGYLVWRYPEKKVFIDGRMPYWKQQSPKTGESANAFAEYAKVMKGEERAEEILRRYGVDTVLLGVEQKEDKIMRVLQKAGMRKVYTDERTVIYRLKRED